MAPSSGMSIGKPISPLRESMGRSDQKQERKIISTLFDMKKKVFKKEDDKKKKNQKGVK